MIKWFDKWCVWLYVKATTLSPDQLHDFILACVALYYVALFAFISLVVYGK